jgi:hypothetical protein
MGEKISLLFSLKMSRQKEYMKSLSSSSKKAATSKKRKEIKIIKTGLVLPNFCLPF